MKKALLTFGEDRMVPELVFYEELNKAAKKKVVKPGAPLTGGSCGWYRGCSAPKHATDYPKRWRANPIGIYGIELPGQTD